MAELTPSSGLSGTERLLDENRSRLVTCRTDELRLHPSYTRLSLAVHACQLSAVAEIGDLVFREALLITHENIILDGMARWKLACLRGQPTLICVEYVMSETEALQYIVQRERRSNGLNGFNRICLALELEPVLKAKGRMKRQADSQNTDSSNLTEVGNLDVRKEIARIAGVSTGNVTKVKQLRTTARSDIIKALRNDDISIHRAWSLSKFSPDEQRDEFWLNQNKGHLGKTIRNLLAAHLPKSSPSITKLDDLIELVSALHSSKLGSVRVVCINVPGKVIFVTEELFRTLEAEKELAQTCAANNR